MTDDRDARIADLLHEAGATHHVVYRIVDGDDPDWASWYADWLLDHSELPQLLGSAPVRSHLVHALVELDRNYTAEPREVHGARGAAAHRGQHHGGAAQPEAERLVEGEPPGAAVGKSGEDAEHDHG